MNTVDKIRVLITAEQANSALNVCLAIGDAIKAAGPEGIPNGHLYATVMDKMSLENYESVIRTLKNVGVVKEAGHVLTWSGK